MLINPEFWRGLRVVLTGHTGFKGAWLTLWLQRLGAEVAALALAPHTEPSLYHLAEVRPQREVIADLNDPGPIADLLMAVQPSIVIHLAAQALVRRSYDDPVSTFATNVMGAAHLLQAARQVKSISAVLIVTSDKVYENPETGHSFAEDDRLGGHDPYSASKACAELLTASFRSSFFVGNGGATVATARAGNVIGGGDWSVDRLVPDIIRAHDAELAVRLRYPHAVRPWQHVLDPLCGYLMMAQAMASAPGLAVDALNFAPDPDNFRTVAQLVEALSAQFGGSPGWEPESGSHPHEAQVLTLSADRARASLGWRPRLDFAETITWTAAWYEIYRQGGDVRQATLNQIDEYAARLQVV
jgi:CDP-glucose 4,6-dehydratase